MTRQHFAALRTALARMEGIASARIELWGRHLADVLDGGAFLWGVSEFCGSNSSSGADSGTGSCRTSVGHG